MKMHISPLIMALSLFNLAAFNATAQGAAFTYQGEVAQNGKPFNGAGQFKFALVTSTNLSQQATATANLSGAFVVSYNVTAAGFG